MSSNYTWRMEWHWMHLAWITWKTVAWQMDEGTTEIILKVPGRTEPMTCLTQISTWNFDTLPTARKIFSVAVTSSPVAEQPPLNTSFMYGCIQWQSIFHIHHDEWKSHCQAHNASWTLCVRKNPVNQPSSPGVQWLENLTGFTEVVSSVPTWNYQKP